MIEINALYTLWKEKAIADPDLTRELAEIATSPEEINDRFYRSLEFGTAGLRGVLGAGTNRMNVYTVNQATQGFADYINGNFENPSVAIAYDSRIKSDYFAKQVAMVFAANNIRAHLFPELMPTPVLSYAVRELGCSAGVILTASHNPAKYNGYKCYGPEGFQITDEAAAKVYDCIQKVDLFDGVSNMDYEKAIAEGRISIIQPSLLQSFLDEVQKQSIHPGLCEKAGLKVIYTPLNGTGNKPVREIMDRIGVKDVAIVKEQELPDGNFPTCPYPNPEIPETLGRAFALADSQPCDLIVATDPDCDRVSVSIPNGGEYRIFSGNETGVLLLEYLLSQRKALGTLPKNPVALKTIVSTELTVPIAKKYGCELADLLTGFKYIGEYITDLEARGEMDRFVLGFEESCGYLVGTHVRDKDAVVAAMLVCEMAAFYKLQGKTLLDVLNGLYDEYGMYLNTVLNFEFDGAQGMTKMADMMSSLRENTPIQIGGNLIVIYADYQEGVIKNLETEEQEPTNLPLSNVLSYKMSGGSGVIVRPSGTEPKIKAYITAKGNSLEDSKAIAAALEKDMKTLLGV